MSDGIDKAVRNLKKTTAPISEIDHPSHYGGTNNPYEVVKVTEAWEKYQDKGGMNISHNLSSAIEYIARCNLKGCKTSDLGKAIWRIQREIDNMGEDINV